MKISLKNSLLVLTAVVLLTGCKEESVKVQTPADYATRSNDDYSLNTYGLVTAENAAKYITNWEKNKPEGKRNLFVMEFGNIDGFDGNRTEQVSATETVTMNNGYIKSNPEKGVYVFDRTSGCTSTGDVRGDGVSGMPKPVFTLQQMDEAFAHYGIDAKKDVIMLALGSPKGEPSKGEYMAGVARMWYTLTYWGFSQKNIMMLNGSATNVLNPDVNPAIAAMGITRNDIFTSLPATPPANPKWRSIKEVRVDGTILQATMEDMMNVVDSNNPNNLILDARGAGDYNGSAKQKAESMTCGAAHNAQCYTAFSGHIKGAKNINFTNVLIMDDYKDDINHDGKFDYLDSSMKFKPIAVLDAMFAAAGYTSDKTVYTYCRTGTKASLLTFTSSAVLGHKARMFDGSWIQWGKMASKPDTYGLTAIPLLNKWLTDTKYSENVKYTLDPLDVNPLDPAYLHLDAEHSNLIILEDKASKYH